MKNESGINFETPEKFIGMEVEKQITKAVCVGYEDYINRNGEKTFLLNWDCVSKLTSKEFKIKTQWRNFKKNMITNHKDDKDPKRVAMGKKGQRKMIQNRFDNENK